MVMSTCPVFCILCHVPCTVNHLHTPLLYHSRYSDIISGKFKSGYNNMGIIEVDMFSPDVDNPHHPVAESFKDLLSEVAEQYDCTLLTFDVDRGVVSFSFDNEELMADIIRILRME